MLCVPRSWAASPWVIERTTQILSAMSAVSFIMLAEDLAVELRLDRAERPAVFDRGVGLGVERLLLGHAAGQEDVDDRSWPCPPSRGRRARRSRPARRCAVLREVIAQRQPQARRSSPRTGSRGATDERDADHCTTRQPASGSYDFPRIRHDSVRLPGRSRRPPARHAYAKQL